MIAGWHQSGVYPLSYDRLVRRDASSSASPTSGASSTKKRARSSSPPGPVTKVRRRVANEGRAILLEARDAIDKAIADGRTDAYMAVSDYAVEVLRRIPTLAGHVEAQTKIAAAHPPPVTATEPTTRNMTFGDSWTRDGLDKQREEKLKLSEAEAEAAAWRAAGKCFRCGGDHKGKASRECKYYEPRTPKEKATPAEKAAAAAALAAEAHVPINPVGHAVHIGHF